MQTNKQWEFITLYLKEKEYLKDDDMKGFPVAVVFCYKTDTSYTPLLVGLNYQYKFSHKNYKQAVYQVVKRANELNVEKVFMGVTATVEKQRVGAIAIPKSVFIQVDDTYNMTLLELASVNEKIGV